jgi:serine/threonine protein kinase
MPPLTKGTRFGPYEILNALGAGGMGEVYRAKDTKLGRDVALKILPVAFTADAERLARFRREAQVLASLNHPHIGSIYGLDEANGQQFLVLELVDGESLDKRIARGAIPVDEALAIARQIAEALEAAHEKGITHRDLKPANIALTKNGNVKVLDFGLAKAMEPASGTPVDLANSPTITSPAMMSGVGMILGTAAYMSPEQARGKVVDKRTDIWAFGCVVFEMLARRRAFAGDTLTDIVAAVMKTDPEWGALAPETPSGVRSVLRRCLKKDPADRLHDIADARIEIHEALEEPPPIVAAPAGVRRETRLKVALPWGLVAVLTLLTAFLIARSGARSDGPGDHPLARLEFSPPTGVELFQGGDAQNIAVSPDGTRAAFVGSHGGVRQIYVRRLDQFDAVPLRGTDTVFSCFFSPNGDAIAFISANSSLKRVSLADGLVVTLTTAGANYTAGGAWGLDDRITFGRGETLWQIPASGGAPTQLTSIDRGNGEIAHAFPATAGPTTMLFSSVASNRKTHIEAVSLVTGKRQVVVESGTFPMYAPTGHLIFFRDDALLAVPFDVNRLAVTGPPVHVVESLGVGPTGAPLTAVSRSGSLIYATSASAASTLVWVSRQGVQEPVTDARRPYFIPRVAPDGRRVVVQTGGDLWIYDTIRATFTRLTSQATFGNSFPVWTPDGRHVVFRTSTGIHLADADGSATSQVIPGTSLTDFPTSIAPDGDTLLINRQTDKTSQDIYVISLRGGSPPKPVVSTPGFDGGAQFSPDGRWMAYVSDESGQMQVYIRPFPAPDRKWQVSTEGGTVPVWNRNGRELFYRTGNKMMAVDVQTAGDVSLSAPRLLFDQPYAFGSTITIGNYDVHPDGQRFLMVKDEPSAGRLNVVLNWFEELKRLVPTAR